MYELPALLQPHLRPIDPILLDYTIQVNQGFSTSRFAIDIGVEVDDPVRTRMQSVINTGITREIASLEDQVSFF